MKRLLLLLVVFAAGVTVAGCDRKTEIAVYDAGEAPDASETGIDAGGCPDGVVACNGRCCAAGERCIAGACTPCPVPCGERCCQADETCGDDGTCKPGCDRESDTAFCARLDKHCGAYTGQDNCGHARTANCGSCGEHQDCDLATNQCRSNCEDDPGMCRRLGAQCGSLTGVDNCDQPRTVDCGTCADASKICNDVNLCVVCIPETDQGFCARLGKDCGTVADSDNCGNPRSGVECGTCTAPRECGSDNVCAAPGRPVNDDCTHPEVIALVAGHGEATGDTTSAVDDGNGSCFQGTGADVVYSFELPAQKDVTITVRPDGATSGFVPYLYLRNDCAQTDPAAERGCAFQSTAGTAALLVLERLDAGVYYLWVDSPAASQIGAFTVSVDAVDPPPVPANDGCGAPEDLVFDPATGKATAAGDTSGAYDDFTASCATHVNLFDGPDVVYSFTVVGSPLSMHIEVTGSGGLQPAVYLRSNCADPATEQACGTVAAPGSAPAVIELPFLPPGTYYVVVDGVSHSKGPFTLEATKGTAVTNDNCSSPEDLVFDRTGVATATGDTTWMAHDYSGSCSGGYARDLVYRFELTAAKDLEIVATPDAAKSSTLKPTLYVRSTCAQSNTELGCMRGTAVAPGSLKLSRVAAGTYYLFVDGMDMGTKGAFALAVTATDPPLPAPANDTCAAAEALSFVNRKATVTATTFGATNDYAGTCSSYYQPQSGPDLVYSFTLATDSAVIAKVTRDAADASVAPALYLRSACASSAAADEKACAFDPAGVAKLAIPDLAAGTWYLIVDSAWGNAGAFRLDVQVLDLIQNDACGGTPTPIALDPAGQATLTGDTALGQDDADGSCNSWTSRDLVYTLTIATPKTVTIVATPDADSRLRPTLYLRSLCDDATTDVQCQNVYDANTPATLQIGRLAAGTYYLWVDGSTNSYDGGFTLQVGAIDPPIIANDVCLTAQALQLDPSGRAHLTGTTLGAGDDLKGTCQTATDYGGDVVYSLQLGAPSQVIATLSKWATSPNYKPALYLRTTCDSALPSDEVACAKDDAYPSTGSATAALASLPAGTYYLIVDGSNDGYFELDVAVSAPLANDNCAAPNAAQPLTFDATGMATAHGDTSAASDDAYGSCRSWTGKDLVYTFSVATVSEVSLDVVPDLGSRLQPTIYVRRACDDPASEVGCVTNSSASFTDLNLPKLGIGTYYLWVDGTGNTAGAFALTVIAHPVAVPPPANDSCSGVQALSFDPVTNKAIVTGDTTYAVDDYRGNCQSSYDPFDGGDLVYAFQLTTPSSLTVKLSAAAHSPLNPAVYLRTTCSSGAAADEIACAPGALGAASVALPNLAIGTYYVVVDGTNDGAFTLELDAGTPITNDNCAGPNAAQPIPFNASGVAVVNGDTRMGTDDGSGTCWPATSGRDLVFSFTTSAVQNVEVLVTPEAGSTLEPLAYLRSACDDPATEVVCGYSAYSTAAMKLKKSRLPAGTWYVWVDGFDGSRGRFELRVTASAPAPLPANDTCRTPEMLTLDPATHKATVTATTLGATDDYAGHCGTGRYLLTGGDRVYELQLTADARVTATVTPGALTPFFAPAVYIRSTLCDSADPADEVACGILDFGPNPGTVGAVAKVDVRWLTPGTYYLIVDGLSARADGLSGAEGDYTLVVQTGPAVTNDTCALPAALAFTNDVATVAGDTSVASDDGDGCTWGWSGADLVYSFTLADVKNVDVSVAPALGSPYVGYLYLRSVCDSKPDQLACQSGWGSAPVTISARRLAPGTYYLWVDSAGPSSTGPFELTVTLSDPPPAPANDTCANPTALVFDPATHRATASGDNTDAGDDYGGSCGNLNGPDLVYSFTLANAALVTATVSNAPGVGALQPAVYLRHDCASSAPADEAACVAGWTSVTTTALLAAGTWYAVVDSVDRTLGAFDLEVTYTELVASDACVNATELVLSSAGMARVVGDTTGARADSDGSCPSAGKDLVYFFTTTAVKTVEITMTPTGGASTTLQPTVHLEQTCNDASTEVACSPAPSVGAVANLMVPRLPAGTWYVWADAATIAMTGAFELAVSAYDPPVPANDTCAGAEALAFDPTTQTATVTTIDTRFAVDSAFGTCGGMRGADVFYTFTTQATQKVTVTLTRSALSPGYEPMFYLQKACASFFSTDEYTCAVASAGQASAIVNALPAGTYWIVVDGMNATAGKATLEVALAAPAAGPANDSCATAAPLTFSGLTATATGSTVNAQPEALGSCSAAGSGDVVYAFTTAQEQKISATVTPDAASPLFQPAVYLRRNCGSGRTEMLCSGASAAAAAASATVNRAPAGTYYLWISSAGSAPTSGGFTVEVALDAALGPANDICAMAIPLVQGTLVSGTTVDATSDSGATLPWWCNSTAVAGPEVVYSFTPAADGTVTVTVTPSGFDAVVWMTETVCGPGSNAQAWADQGTSGAVEVLTFYGAGWHTYYLFVDGSAAGDSGSFTIEAQ